MSRAVLLAGLIWVPLGSNDSVETKKGVPLYNGTAARFEVWVCRIHVKLGVLDSVKDKDDKRQQIIEYGVQGNRRPQRQRSPSRHGLRPGQAEPARWSPNLGRDRAFYHPRVEGR